MRYLVLASLMALAAMIAVIASQPPLTPDDVCPAGEVRIRYPEHMADYHDGSGRMKHYRLAYCKPTGIKWR